MIMSVSMLTSGMGAAMPLSWVNLSIVVLLRPARVAGHQLADIREPARDRRRGGHGGGGEMGPTAAALAAFEVAVGGGHATLARGKLIGVHGEAHGAAREAPFEARVDEDLREPLLLGLGAHEAGARNHHGAQAVLDLLALQDRRGGAQVLDPAVGAGADEDRVDLDVLEALAGPEAHVVERAARSLDLAAREVLGRRHGAGDGQHVLGARAPSHDGGDVLAANGDHLVEMRALVGVERAPPGQRGLPLLALGGMGAALHVSEGLLVGRDQARPRAALDGHVADRHAAFHAELADRLPAVLDDVAGAARGAGVADDRQGDVLGGDAGTERPGDLHLHVPGLLLDQRLRGQNVLDLGGADAMGERPEGPVRRGVGVAAHDRHAGQRPALLGPDDVHDACRMSETG
jgi:hypothetical protein